MSCRSQPGHQARKRNKKTREIEKGPRQRIRQEQEIKGTEIEKEKTKLTLFGTPGSSPQKILKNTPPPEKKASRTNKVSKATGYEVDVLATNNPKVKLRKRYPLSSFKTKKNSVPSLTNYT